MSLQRNAVPARLFAVAIRLASWLQALSGKLTPPPFRVVRMGAAFWQSRALFVAARLDVATALGQGSLTAEEIAARTGANADALCRLLRLLAASGVFREVAPRVFANNEASEWLRGDKAGNVRAMVLMHNSETMSRPWYERLEEGVRTGTVPFELVHGREFYDYQAAHPDFGALFAQAMDSVEALAGDGFATDFDWGRFERVIDVGGSRGSKSMAILLRHPRVEALVIDRATVVREAGRARAGQAVPEVLSRLRFQEGDLLGEIPAARGERDIYLLSAVLHGMDDETASRGLRNLAIACGRSGARVAILELVLPEQGADATAASFDLQMLMATRGRERSLGEWMRLAAAGGFELEEVVALRSFASILVLRAAS